MNEIAKVQVPAASQQDLGKILEDFAALRRDFTELMGHVKSGAVNGAGDASAAVQSSIAVLGEQGRVVYDKLAAQGERSVKAIGRQVEERPVTSLLVAFAVGLVAGRLLSR